MEKITVTLITRNCAQSLSECLRSIAWVDEIVVVDQGSTDGTIEICLQYGVKVHQSVWLGFGRTKQLAVAKATNNWIFSIDSDEICTDELKEALLQHANSTPRYSAFKIKRLNHFLGKPIRFSGWQNDFPVRFFRKDKAGFNENDVHEYVETEGIIGTINKPLYHYSFPTYSSFIQKTDNYSTISAQTAYNNGKKASLTSSLFKSVFKFVKMYVFQLGFLDGAEGFVLAKSSAFSVYIKYVKLYELTHLSQHLSDAKK